ncbi:MAG: hypothetical protein ACE5GZ_13035 [Gammaproteobacteria bacterium]
MITGKGRAFCAGFNLKKIPEFDEGLSKISDHFRELAMWWHQVFHKMVRMPKARPGRREWTGRVL